VWRARNFQAILISLQLLQRAPLRPYLVGDAEGMKRYPPSPFFEEIRHRFEESLNFQRISLTKDGKYIGQLTKSSSDEDTLTTEKVAVPHARTNVERHKLDE
jgi:hypothetical protein